MIQEIIEKTEREIQEKLALLKILDEKRAEKLISSSDYQEYINSKEWEETRARIFKRDNYHCVICGTGKNLSCHHITYENLGNEKDADLITICQDCHNKEIHGADSKSLFGIYRCIENAQTIAIKSMGVYCIKEFGIKTAQILKQAKDNIEELWSE